MVTNDSSNPAQCPLELVEILKRLGAHRRELHAQVFGKPLWTCQQSEATVRQLGLLRSDGKPRWTREQSDAYWHHPLVRACEWLEERVGISRHDLEHAAFRLTTPLGLKGMEPLPSPDGDLLTAQEEKAKRELCELYDLMAADKTPPEVKGQGKPVQLTEKQLAALAGLRPKSFQVISEEQAEALAQLPGRAVKRKRPSEGDPGMPDWLWMTAKFRELDLDGTTDRLWQLLVEDYPAILADSGMLVPSLSQIQREKQTPASVDLQDYLSATEIRTKHTPPGVVLEHRRLVKFLSTHPAIRTANPPGNDGNPRKNRLIVHLADWIKHQDALKEWDTAYRNLPIDAVPVSEIEKRTAAVRRKKQGGK